MFILGCGPLLFILGATVGLWPDSDPNPVGPGILASLTFWPSLVCIAAGVLRIRLGRGKNAG